MKTRISFLCIVFIISIIQSPVCSQDLTIEGTWFLDGGSTEKPCEITQNGNNLILINENGDKSSGIINENKYIIATTWGNLKGTLVGENRINWSNSTSWYRQLSLEGIWYIGGSNKECRIDQNGNKLTFINENGAKSSGDIGTESVVATDWGNLKGILSDNLNKISWDNGTYWYRNSTSSPSALPVDVAGSWTVGERGRLNFWQNGNEYKVVISWPQYGGSRWITLFGEGIFEGRLMKFRVTYASKDGTSKPSRYVYFLTLSDDNNSITGYYTENGVKMEGEYFYYSRVK